MVVHPRIVITVITWFQFKLLSDDNVHSANPLTLETVAYVQV